MTIPIAYLKRWQTWAHGVVGAFIGGGATSGVMIGVDPQHFNFSTGMENLKHVFVAAGIVNALTYLKKSPLPDLVETTTVTATVTKEVTTPTVPENKQP